MRDVVAIFAGVALALPYVLYARRRRRALGYGLIAAAAIYVVFAAVAGDVRAVLVEIVGLGAFAGIAIGFDLVAAAALEIGSATLER